MGKLSTLNKEKEQGSPKVAIGKKLWKRKGIDNLQSLFTLDLRSLALLRIGIALVLLLDLILRFGDLEAHYTDAGVLPLSALFRYAWNPYHFSLYTIASSFPLQAALFLVNMSCVCCLLLGYRTRLFTFICWVFLISLHNRNPLVQQAGDDLLRLIVFWGLFLPWGYYYSLDAQKESQTSERPTQYNSFAGFAYILQLFSVYFFAALLKTSPEWTTDFTALYYALSLDQILLPFGKLLYPYEELLKVLTMATYFTEMLLPFVLLIPFFSGWFRLLFFAVISALHIGIALSLNVGLFPLISIVAMLGLLPGFLIKRVDGRLKNWWHNLAAMARNLSHKKGSRAFPRERLLISLLVLFFMVYTFFWNVRTTGASISQYGMNWVGHLLRIDQYWSMFAPSVFKDDGWFILEGTTEEGKKFDILRKGQPTDFAKPDYMAGTYKNDRWRKYAENILFVFNSHYRPYYCRYMMKKWNESHSEKINHLEVIYMKVPSLPEYKEDGPFEEHLCNCYL